MWSAAGGEVTALALGKEPQIINNNRRAEQTLRYILVHMYYHVLLVYKPDGNLHTLVNLHKAVKPRIYLHVYTVTGLTLPGYSDVVSRSTKAH